MKLILPLLFTALFASYAAAFDTHRLHRSGFWSVELIVSGNALDCRLVNNNPDEGVLSIVYGHTTPYPMMYVSVYEAEAGRSRVGQVDLHFDIHNGNRAYAEEWNLYNANYELNFADNGSSWLFVEFAFSRTDVADEFLEHIAAYLHLQLLDRHFQPLAYWSLQGSRDAVNRFYDCLNSL